MLKWYDDKKAREVYDETAELISDFKYNPIESIIILAVCSILLTGTVIISAVYHPWLAFIVFSFLIFWTGIIGVKIRECLIRKEKQ